MKKAPREAAPKGVSVRSRGADVKKNNYLSLLTLKVVKIRYVL